MLLTLKLSLFMMRLLVIVVFSLFTIHLSAATYYVAPANATPAGNDAAAGDKSHPWASWEKAFTSRKPGDTIIFRGGVYPTTVTSGAGITKTVTGTADKWVVFMNYPGEVPVLDCSNITSTWYGNTYGLKLSGSYYKLIGLTIRNVWQIDPANPADETYAFRTSGDNYTLERCTAHSTHGSGFFPSGSNVRITNCDSYDHCDSLSTSLPGNDGYGYFHYNTGTTGSIYYKDCRAWDNGDDGWALADNSYVEIDGCWSFNNGRMEGAGNGFKIGFIPQKASVPLLRVVKNSIAAFNRASGLTTNDNNDYTIAPSQIYNNVAFHNGYYSEWNNPVYGFYLYSTNGTDQEELQRILRNNISYKNQGGAVGDGYYHDVLFTHSHNSWDISGLTVADADFMSVDSTGISGPRQADGSLPALNFLKLASSSKLIDKGVDVGLPYTGSAPDLGIAEASATATAPVARITAPATTILTCTTLSITLTATGGATYSWSDGTRVVGTSGTLTVSAPGNYTVTVTSSDGLTDTETIAITSNTTPPVVTLTNTTGTTVLTCATPSISVTAGGGVSYSWHDGTKVVATTATINITAPATYTVTVTSSTGCTATKAITITQDKTAPAVTLTNTTGTTILTCATPSISVTAGGGVSYSWHDGTKVVATTATLTITAPATYTVTVTSSTGCTATKAITIIQDKTAPAVTLTNTTGTTILTCATPSITVTAGGGVSYSWHDGTKVVATTATLNITAPATYTVTVSSSTGCTATKSITTTQDKTAPVVTLTNQTGTTVLSATTPSVTVIAGGGISYSWHNGTQVVATTAALTITAPATYTVTVTGSNGCTSTKAITITREADTPAAPVATVTQPGCGESGGSIQFTSPLPGTGYFYSINGTDYTNTTGWFSNVPQGSYNLSVKSSAGMVSPTTPVTIQQALIQPAAPTASVTQQPSCAVNTGTIVVSSPVGGAGYTYSIDGVSYGTASTFTGLVSGSYQVTVRYGTTGCISPATALTVNPAPDDNVQPVFPTFGPYSEGSASVVLPVVSDNGIRGSWSPATVSTATPGSFLYTFTPDPGKCATILTVTIKILVVEVTGETQLRRVISSGSDDVEETSRGTVVINSPDIELVYDNLLTGNQMVGFRFNNITIPAGATITRAYIQFSVAETTYGTTSLRIYGQKSEHAGVFTTARRGVSKRPRTTASVAWSPTPSGGSAVGSRGVGQQTPDLAPLMQEILSLSGWQPGNSMAFIINGYGKRNAVAYEGSKTNAAELVVEYIEPAATASATLVTKKALLPTAAGQEAGLTCYPVPFGETLHINILQGTQEQPRMMGLFDLSGRKVKSLDHTATTQSVATGDLPPGVYLLRMVTDKNEIVKKIIKQ
jgi:hypothetical protein